MILASIERACRKKYAVGFRHIVIAGTGGSVLKRPHLELRIQNQSIEQCFYYLDTIDPDVMEQCLDVIDVEESCFLVISRSGTTAETLGQFYVLLSHVENKLGKIAHPPSISPSSPIKSDSARYGARPTEYRIARARS